MNLDFHDIMEFVFDKSSTLNPEERETCPACNGKGMYKKSCFSVDEFGGPFLVTEEVVWEDCSLCKGACVVKVWVARNYKEINKNSK